MRADTIPIVVTIRLRRRRGVRALCRLTGRQLKIHDRRRKRWRHLGLGASRCMVECELRGLRCGGMWPTVLKST